MNASPGELNDLLARWVACYERRSTHGREVWVLPDGSVASRAPNFTAGERTEDVWRGLERLGLAREFEQLTAPLDAASPGDLLGLLRAALQLAQNAQQEEFAEQQLYAGYGLTVISADADDVAALQASLNTFTSTLRPLVRRRLFDRLTFVRDETGQLWAAYQTYAEQDEILAEVPHMAHAGLRLSLLNAPTQLFRLFLLTVTDGR